MESSGMISTLRNRVLGGLMEADLQSTAPERTSEGKIAADGGRKAKAEKSSFEDDDGWTTVFVSVARIVTCFATMMMTTFVWAIIMLLLLPWPYARIRQGNVYGHLTGWLMMKILGNRIEIQGSEYASTRGIYICNHTSPLDIFLVMWLAPTGTVGIAKKEIVWYPLFGQLYVLANHLRIDRSNSTAAVESIKRAAHAVMENNLSLVIFPEGTRSQSGRLIPFKKGFVHIALQTGLPIVPIVVTGAHRAWRKNSLRLRPSPLAVKFLPPIKTHDWDPSKINDYVDFLHSLHPPPPLFANPSRPSCHNPSLNINSNQTPNTYLDARFIPFIHMEIERETKRWRRRQGPCWDAPTHCC